VAFSGILARQDFSDPSVFQPHGFEVDCPGNYSESLPDAAGCVWISHARTGV